MSRISPNDGRQYSFNGLRSVSAEEFFTPASELARSDNYRAREIAQLLTETNR